jgi:hypothetical protein
VQAWRLPPARGLVQEQARLQESRERVQALRVQALRARVPEQVRPRAREQAPHPAQTESMPH